MEKGKNPEVEAQQEQQPKKKGTDKMVLKYAVAVAVGGFVVEEVMSKGRLIKGGWNLAKKGVNALKGDKKEVVANNVEEDVIVPQQNNYGRDHRFGGDRRFNNKH